MLRMKKSTPLITVFLAVFIDLIGFGIVLPLLPFYASVFSATPVQIGLLYSIYSLAQLIFSPIWGGFSDRVGRRPIMLLTTLADRAKGMGLIGAAFGIGFVLGPAISSLLIHPSFLKVFKIAEEYRYAIPGFFAALLSFTSFLLVYFKLPETVAVKSNEGSKRARPLIFTKTFWQAPLSPILLSTMFLLAFSHASLYSSFPLFSNRQLNLSAGAVGLLYVCMGLISVVVQGFLIRPLTRKFKEERLFLIGSI